jgi:uncharacterized membrane protein
MKKLFLFLFGLSLLFPSSIFAQSPQPTYEKAHVDQIVKSGETTVGGSKNLFQIVKLTLLSGKDKGKQIQITYGDQIILSPSQTVHPGETVIIQETAGKAQIIEKYRTPWMLSFIMLFFLCVFLLSGKKGLGAIAGMVISLSVIIIFVVPQILSGSDPLLVSIAGSIFIMFTSIYLAHGFSKQTTVAVGATCISLAITALLAISSVSLFRLSGLGSEDAYSLQQGFNGIINFPGLLLGGIIIGTLGALDDVTTTQTTTIFELFKTDQKLSFQELFQKGMVIGREHIASLVNTLILAYAGASIGVFIFLILGIRQHAQPLWVMLNSELITEEVVRSLVGSLGIVIAVPLTTAVAAFFAKHEIKIH